MTPRRRSGRPRGPVDEASPVAYDLFDDPAVGSAAPDAVGEPRGAYGPGAHPWEPAPSDVPGATPRAAVAVTVLTHIARDVLEGAFVPLWVRGEVTDFKSHRNGHWYFCLRDANAQVRCVVWSRDQRRIPAPPEDGMEIVALGQLTVYPTRGEMQLAVKALAAAGDGLWRKALDVTRARLEADGLLAPERKRPLPRCPRRVAVVTSPDGAALRDIVAVARRRCAAVEVVVVPAKVQGDGAPEELCYALDQIARWRGADVVIIGRGGGAREDLWAFNDERVARALAACPVPTVSAVGHEIDVTICDLVADARAPTPSAAAEAAVPVADDLRRELRAVAAALRAEMGERLTLARGRLDCAAGDALDAVRRSAERARTRLEGAAGRLHALSPVATLARGYAVARGPGGEPLAGVADFAPGMSFDLTVRDGTVGAVVQRVEPAPVPAPPDPSREPT